MKPTISILDPRFKYVPSHKTDIRRTFRKARLLAKISAKQRPSSSQLFLSHQSPTSP